MPGRRALAAAAALQIAFVLLDVGPALADGGHGGTESDYSVEIVAIAGRPDGIDIEVIELGDRLELTRDGAEEVVVLGYEDEPYLRLDASGVFENVRSPTVYLNRDRYADTRPPASADAHAEPQWRRVSDGDVVRWHDHRAHWMASIPPKEAQDDPGREHVASVGEVPVIVDGERITVTVRVTWVPAPERALWWGATAAIAVAAGVILARRRSVVAGAAAVLVAALGFAISDVPSTPRAAIGVGLVAMAAAAGRVRRPDALALAGAIVLALGLTRLTVFDHPVLDGRVGAHAMRIALVVCLAGSAAGAIAGLVESFRPTTTQRPAPARR